MIGQTETEQADGTELTAAEYGRFKDLTEVPSYAIQIERWSLGFEAHTTGGVADNSRFQRDGYDVCVCGTVMLRTYADDGGDPRDLLVERLVSEDSSDQTWTAAGTQPTTGDYLFLCPPSIVPKAGGGEARLFYYTTGGTIKYCDTSDYGATWGSSTTLATVANVRYLSATSDTKLHYVTYTSSGTGAYNSYLHSAEYNGSWSTTDSDIYYPFPFEGFDAIAVSTTRDVLVTATNIPPIIGTRVENTAVQRIAYNRQGLIGFYEQNGRWSDHFTIDIFDKSSDYQCRKYPRLSQCGDFFFLICHGVDGYDSNYSTAHTRYYTSLDGINWRQDTLASFGDDALCSGMLLAPDTKYAYLIDIQYTYRTLSTRMTGGPHSSIKYTGGHDVITQLQSTFGRMRQTSISMPDPDGDLAETVLGTGSSQVDAEYIARMFLGYWSSVDSANLQVLTSTELVDTEDVPETLPAQHLNLTTRDWTAWLTDRVKSDHIREYAAQMLGRDDFHDETETGRAGLSHTARYEGAWRSPEDTDELHAISLYARCLALSTWRIDIWNGEDQIGFYLPSDADAGETVVDEYAGIVFRAFDKDNLWEASYQADTDKIHLYEKRGGTATDVAQSSTLSWTEGNWYCLRVQTYYSTARVWSSTDGLDWTLQITYVTDGETQLPNETYVPIQMGQFGQAGYGWSDEDVPVTEPGDVPPPGGDDTPGSGDMVYIQVENAIGRTRNFTDSSPNYENVALPSSPGTMYRLIIDPWKVSESGLTASLIAADNGLFITEDLQNE